MRLNNQIRDHVREKALFRAFDQKLSDFRREYQMLALQFYYDLIANPSEVEDLRKYSKWVATTISWEVECSELVTTNYRGSANLSTYTPSEIFRVHNGKLDRWYRFSERLPKNIRLPQAMPRPALSNTELKITGGSRQYASLETLQKKWEAIWTDYVETDRNIKAMLSSVATKAKLLEVWPEVEGLLPAEAKKSVAVVPIELTTKLNEVIGLP